MQDLADRARQASAQVQGQVTDIQTVTARALATTQVGRQAAAEAVAQAAQTRAAHDAIRTIVGVANLQAEQIAQGTDQQRMAAGQVLFALRAFVETIREMADGGHRVADAAHQLSTLAGALDITPRDDCRRWPSGPPPRRPKIRPGGCPPWPGRPGSPNSRHAGARPRPSNRG